jgi:hypothetical protein
MGREPPDRPLAGTIRPGLRRPHARDEPVDIWIPRSRGPGKPRGSRPRPARTAGAVARRTLDGFISNVSGRFEVYVQPSRAGGIAIPGSAGGGQSPQVSRRPRALQTDARLDSLGVVPTTRPCSRPRSRARPPDPSSYPGAPRATTSPGRLWFLCCETWTRPAASVTSLQVVEPVLTLSPGARAAE